VLRLGQIEELLPRTSCCKNSVEFIVGDDKYKFYHNGEPRILVFPGGGFSGYKYTLEGIKVPVLESQRPGRQAISTDIRIRSKVELSNIVFAS